MFCSDIGQHSMRVWGIDQDFLEPFPQKTSVLVAKSNTCDCSHIQGEQLRAVVVFLSVSWGSFWKKSTGPDFADREGE